MIKYFIILFIILSFLFQYKDFYYNDYNFITYEYDNSALDILKEGERYWWQKSIAYQNHFVVGGESLD